MGSIPTTSLETKAGKRFRDGSPSLSFRLRTEWRMLALFVVIAGVYWLWIALFHRSIETDPGISILAAMGVLDHGYPVLPSGYLYPRAYAHTYLLAGSIGLFGLNEFSVVLPSLIAGLGSLVLAHLICRDLLGSSLAGFMTVGLLILSTQEAYIATSARMYMLFQFFTLLAVYAAWRGLVQGDRRYKWIAVAALGAAVMTHALGPILPIAVVLAASLGKFLEVGDPRQWDFGFAEVTVLALVPIGVFTVFYSPPGSMEGIAVHGGMEMERLGFEISLQSVRAQIGHFERMFPFTLFLFPLAAFPIVRESSRDGRNESPGFSFLVTVFLVAVGVLVAMLQASAARYVIWIVPIYVGIVMASLTYLWERRQAVSRWALVGGAVLWALGSVGSLIAANTPYVADAYGIPCSRTTEACNIIVERTYREIQTEIAPGDRVVSDVPWVTNFYLGRVDGFLRQARSGGRLGAFEEATDEYFGAQLIDTRQELLGLLAGEGRAWVIIDNQFVSRFVSDEFLELLDEEFRLMTRNESLTVYVAP